MVENQVICNDGTIEEEAIGGEAIDVRNCLNHGGIKQGLSEDQMVRDYNPLNSDNQNASACPSGTVWNQSMQKCESIAPKPKGYTTTQKWLAVIGITAVCYFILHKAGSLK